MSGRRALHLRAILVGIGLGASACRATVPLEVPPAPAVAITDDRIAVVAGERSCQAAADALALELPRSSYLVVDPRATVRVELLGCGDDQVWTVEQQGGLEGDRRRTRVEARAHAVVQVSEQGRLLAHLIGAGREEDATAWHEDGARHPQLGLLGFRRLVRNRVHADLARDVIRQLNPLPTLVQRRVYPNASAGTSRELVTLAVRAEQRGDLSLALELAELAWLRDPSPRIAGYVQELKRRSDTSPR